MSLYAGMTGERGDKIQELEQRIAKAREILKETLQRTSWRGYDTAQTDTRRALEALEGK